MTIKKFHHAAIAVTDIEKGVNWYTDTLSASILYKDDTWALLAIGDSKIALVLPNEHPPHLAFEWSNAEKFGLLKKHRDGTASVYVEDPFGNTLEFLKPLAKENLTIKNQRE